MAAVDPLTMLAWAAVTFATPMVLAVVPLTRRQVSDRVIHLMLGFSAGLLLAIAVMDILPETFHTSEETGLDVRLAMLMVAVGFLVLLVAHRHLVPHRHVAGEGAPYHEAEGHEIAPMGTLALGALTVHGLVDGLVIPLGFSAGTEVGLVITLAVALHQIPDSIAALTVALASGRRGRRAAAFVLVTALDTPLGIGIGLLLLGAGSWLVPLGLGFSAGTFLYVSSADIIPELQHRSRSTLVVLSILGGVAVVAALTLLFPL